jgi:dethiobiotin synthetase
MSRPPVSRETIIQRVILVATGTSVGKTHTALSLVQAIASTGAQVAGLKPIESGVVAEASSDFGRLAGASTLHVKPPPYALAEPVSPHLAARRAGIRITVSAVRRWVNAHHGICVIETAGGLLSPLDDGLTNLDLLAALLPAHVVLVAPDRLGVLHDISACQLALWSTITPDALVVLQPPETADASTGTNASELRTLSIASQVLQYPRADPTSPATLAAAANLCQLLRTTAPSNLRRLSRRKTR